MQGISIFQQIYAPRVSHIVNGFDGISHNTHSPYAIGGVVGSVGKMTAIVANDQADTWHIVNLKCGKIFDAVAVLGAFDESEAANMAMRYHGQYFDAVCGDVCESNTGGLQRFLNHPVYMRTNRPVYTEELAKLQDVPSTQAILWDGVQLKSHNGSSKHLLLDMMRCDDDKALLEKMDFVEEESQLDGEIAEYDALVVEAYKLESTVSKLALAMDKATSISTLKVANQTLSKPKTMRGFGVIQQLVSFELSDGQAVSIIFNVSDSEANASAKMTKDDLLVAWKYKLNSRDITAAVQPNATQNVSLNMIASRIMGLADANSEKFVAAQKKKDAMQTELANTNQQVKDLQSQEQALLQEIADLQKQLDRLNKLPDKVVKNDTQANQEPVQEPVQDLIAAIRKIFKKTGTVYNDGTVDFIESENPYYVMRAANRFNQYIRNLSLKENKVLEQFSVNVRKSVSDYFDKQAEAKEPVTQEPIQLTGKELGNFPDTEDGKKALRSAAKAEFEKLLGQWVDCPALNGLEGENTKVEIRKRGMKEFFAFSGDTRKLKLVSAIGQIIKTAKIAPDSWQPNNKTDKKPSTLGYYHLSNSVKLDGDVFNLRVIIEKDNNGLLHYDVIVSDEQAIDVFDGVDNNLLEQPCPDNNSGGSPSIKDSIENEHHPVNVFDSVPSGYVVNLFIEGEPAEVVPVEEESEQSNDTDNSLAGLSNQRVSLTDKDVAEMPYEQYAKMVFNGQIADDRPPASIRFNEQLAYQKQLLADFNAKKVSRAKILGTPKATDKDVRDYLLKNINELEDAIATEGASDAVIRKNWEYAVKQYARQLGLETKGKLIDDVLKDISVSTQAQQPSEPEPTPTTSEPVQPVSEPPMTNPDRDYLQSIIDGALIPKESDMDTVIELAEKYENDEFITPLLEQALEVINQTQQAAVKGVV